MSKKNASKSTSKASLNLKLNHPNKNRNKRKTNKIKKQMKKLGIGSIALIFVFVLFGAVIGFFGIKIITKNDCFELIGEDEITLTLDKTYKDDGVKIISFGKDFSRDVIINTNLIQNDDNSYLAEQEGTYYIEYTVDNLLYGKLFKIKKVRLISFVTPSEADEFLGE